MRNFSKYIFSSILLLLVGCSPKLSPLKESQFQITPTPLVVQGDKINAEVAFSVPAKWLKKKATIRLLPVMRCNNQEIWGKSATLQGEEVLANNPVISYSKGGFFSFHTQFEYTPQMLDGELYMTFHADIKGKKVKLPPVLLTQGVISTANWASISANRPYFAPNQFERIIQEKYDTEIQFLIEQAKVRKSELKKKDLKAWKKRVEEASEADNRRVKIEVQAYASPDGGVELNSRLSEQREQNTTLELKREFSGISEGSIPITAHYSTAQDWDGFRRYLEASDIPDKELILRVLSMYDDPEEREREIRNISAGFDQLATEIFPKLRRSRLTATIETIGKSDNELLHILENAPQSLDIEELLYAITLTPAHRQEEYLMKAKEIYPRESRIYNNIAAINIAKGNLPIAEKWLQKAEDLETLPEIELNKALLAIERGDLEVAEISLGNAIGTPRCEEVLGFLQLKQGKFQEAAKSFGETISNNAAIAYIMTKNYAKATDILDKVTVRNATTEYLRAVVAARMGDALGASNFLKEAFYQNPTLRSHAARDLEFDLVKKKKGFDAGI